MIDNLIEAFQDNTLPEGEQALEEVSDDKNEESNIPIQEQV